jgi:hypothetical protein
LEREREREREREANVRNIQGVTSVIQKAKKNYKQGKRKSNQKNNNK